MRVTMKDLFTLLAIPSLLFALSTPATGFKPQQTQKPAGESGSARIEIVEFAPNNYISGRIAGISPSEYGRYKVVVYVKTDKWYLHPYERGGDGLSYASLNRQGEWKINTIRRGFKADKVAYFLVDLDYVPPAVVMDTKAVRCRLIRIEDGGGRL